MLSEYRLMLNPAKCTFRVKFNKFLVFMMSERGIKANPHKVKAVLALVKPRCIKDIQRLNGCIATLGRFISKSAERCIPFFKALKTLRKTFFWSKECVKAQEDLKDYLAKLPLLSAPTSGEVLYMYLHVSQQAVALVLARDSNDRKLSIYFVSRVTIFIHKKFGISTGHQHMQTSRVLRITHDCHIHQSPIKVGFSQARSIQKDVSMFHRALQF